MTGIFDASTAIAENHFQIAFLAGDPAAHEIGWVQSHALEEVVAGFGLRDGLDGVCDLRVECCHLDQRGRVFWVIEVFVHQRFDRVFHGDLDVVHRWAGVFLEGLVDADGKWQSKRFDWGEMRREQLGDGREEDLFVVEDLEVLVRWANIESLGRTYST